MWCIATSSTYSCSPIRSNLARNSDPWRKSKAFHASSSTTLCASASCSSFLSTPRKSSPSILNFTSSPIICTSKPSFIPKLVRSTSCRLTMSFSAVSITSSFRSPRSRTANAMLYAPLSGSISCKNHNRCCAYDSGSSLSRGTAASTGPNSCPPPLCRFTRSANPATVGALKNARNGSSTPNAVRTRTITCVAKSEWPPSSKKFCSTPTDSHFSTREKIPHRISSSAVRSPCPSPPLAGYPGSGKALRSTFPFGVSGKLSSTTNLPGSMYSGNFALSRSRNLPVSHSTPRLPFSSLLPPSGLGTT